MAGRISTGVRGNSTDAQNLRHLRHQVARAIGLLDERGETFGLVGDRRWRAFCDKREAIEAASRQLKNTRIAPGSAQAERLERRLAQPISRDYALMDLLKRPELDYAALAELFSGDGRLPAVEPAVAEQLDIEARYSGYIERQREEIARNRQHEQTPLPEDFDYHSVDGLSNEAREILKQARPESLGAAARLSGMTPAALLALLAHVRRPGAAKPACESAA